MKKHLFGILVLFCLLLTGCTFLHMHSYDMDYYVYDEEYHWHQPTCKHQDAVKDKGVHTRNPEGICTVCNYNTNLDNISYSIEYQDPDGVLNPDYNPPKRAQVGEEVSVKVSKVCDADVLVYVNGVQLTEMPVEYDEYNLYKFTMPNEKVTVLFDIVTVPDTVYLHYVEAWLWDLDSADVTEISVETGYIGAASGSKTDIVSTNDREEIERLVSAWKQVTVDPVYDNSWQIDGGRFSRISFMLSNGQVHSIYSANGYYTTEGLTNDPHFMLHSFPAISGNQ